MPHVSTQCALHLMTDDGKTCVEHKNNKSTQCFLGGLHAAEAITSSTTEFTSGKIVYPNNPCIVKFNRSEFLTVRGEKNWKTDGHYDCSLYTGFIKLVPEDLV